jgi:two-component system chemotaxis response regulator CheY
MRRILVVDDSATMRSLYKQLLGHMKNTTLHFACDGKQGLEMFGAVEPHLMFLDINMPEMNGLEVLRELGRTGALDRAPVVLVTTEGTDADIERGLASGATEYLRKPFKLNAVREIVDRLAPWTESITAVRATAAGSVAKAGGDRS